MSGNQVEGNGDKEKGKKGADEEAGDKSTERRGKNTGRRDNDEKQGSDSGTVMGEINDTTRKDSK